MTWKLTIWIVFISGKRYIKLFIMKTYDIRIWDACLFSGMVCLGFWYIKFKAILLFYLNWQNLWLLKQIQFESSIFFTLCLQGVPNKEQVEWFESNYLFLNAEFRQSRVFRAALLAKHLPTSPAVMSSHHQRESHAASVILCNI